MPSPRTSTMLTSIPTLSTTIIQNITSIITNVTSIVTTTNYIETTTRAETTTREENRSGNLTPAIIAGIVVPSTLLVGLLGYCGIRKLRRYINDNRALSASIDLEPLGYSPVIRDASIENMSREIQNLKKQLHEERIKRNLNTNPFESSDNPFDGNFEDIARLEDEVQKLNNELVDARKTINRMRSERNSDGREVENLNTKLQNKIQSLTQQLDDMRDKYTDARSQANRIIGIQSNLQKTIENLNKEISEKDRQIQRLTAQYDKSIDANERLILEEENQKLKGDLEMMKRDLVDLIKENDRAKSEIEKYKHEAELNKLLREDLLTVKTSMTQKQKFLTRISELVNSYSTDNDLWQYLADVIALTEKIEVLEDVELREYLRLSCRRSLAYIIENIFDHDQFSNFKELKNARSCVNGTISRAVTLISRSESKKNEVENALVILERHRDCCLAIRDLLKTKTMGNFTTIGFLCARRYGDGVDGNNYRHYYVEENCEDLIAKGKQMLKLFQAQEEEPKQVVTLNDNSGVVQLNSELEQSV